MKESDIEADCRRLAESLGGSLIKIIPTIVGWPDRLLVLPDDWGNGNPFISFIEFKRPGGAVRAIQDQRISELRAMGCNVVIIDSVKAFTDYLKANL